LRSLHPRGTHPLPGVSTIALPFVLGVSPLLFATGAGFASRVSGNYVVIFGMLAAMVSDMLFVPVLYLAFRHVRKRVIGAPKATGMENVMAG